MTTREEAIQHINRIYDATEAEGRHVIGLGVALVHTGQREGADHQTIECRTLTMHPPLTATALLGGVDVLRARVLDRIAYAEEL